MREIRVMVLAVCLLLPLSGCAGFGRTEKASLGGSGGPAGSKSGEGKDISATSNLERHGFAVFGFRSIRDNYNRVSVVGEIKNIGSAARGVELQASLRNADGRVVAVGHFCPASNRNIVPGETWPFTYSFGVQEEAVEAELRIVGAFRTADILNAPMATR
jgi:hypothetical protein